MKGSLETAHAHSQVVAMLDNAVPWRSAHSLFCVPRTAAFQIRVGFVPVHFFLPLQAFGYSLCVILCPWSRRHDNIGFVVPVSAKGQSQGLISVFCGTFGGFFSSSQSSPSFPYLTPLPLLLKMFVCTGIHACMPPHTWKLEDKLSCRFWLPHCLGHHFLLFTCVFSRLTG